MPINIHIQLGRQQKEIPSVFNPIDHVRHSFVTKPHFPSFICDAFRIVEAFPRPEYIKDNPEANERIYEEHLENFKKANELCTPHDIRLQDKILEFGKQLGITFLRNDIGTIETPDTNGHAYVMEVARTEPPMTAKEARQIGDLLVTQWETIRQADKIPEYCDTIFPLPPDL